MFSFFKPKKILEIYVPGGVDHLQSFLDRIKEGNENFEMSRFESLWGEYTSFIGTYKLNFKKDGDKDQLKRFSPKKFILQDYSGKIVFPKSLKELEELVEQDKAIISFEKLDNKIISRKKKKYFIESMF